MFRKSNGLIVAFVTGFICSSTSASEFHNSNADAFGGVAETVEHYITLRKSAQEAAEPNLIDEIWTGRFIEDGKIRAAERNEIMTVPKMLKAPQLTSVQSFLGDFAIARIDDWTHPSAAILALFRTDSGWRVASESIATSECAERADRFDPKIATREVLRVLNIYYTSVEAGDAVSLSRAHHPSWRMKNHENGKVVAEDGDVFAKRREAGKYPGYASDRQIADVQVIYNCLAFVRIDKPSSGGVTVFTFFRDNEKWMIVEKAWTSPK